MGSALDRRDRRYPVRIPGVILSRKGEVPVLTGDVSFRGAFLRTDNPPQLRQLLRVRFEMPPEFGPSPADRELSTTGMVAHVVSVGDAAGRAPGAGVEFYGLDGELRDKWERFIHLVEAHHADAHEEPAVIMPGGAVDPVQRRHPRFDRQIRVELVPVAAEQPGTNPCVATTEDISRGGMFIRTDLPFSVGAGLLVTLAHSAVTFPIECIVRRRVFGTRAGIAVEFMEMSPQTTLSLIDFLKPVGAVEATALNATSPSFV